MGAGRPFVGRKRETTAAVEALRRRRSVIVTGPGRSGRSRLLSAVVTEHARPVIVLERRATGVVMFGARPSDRRPVTDADDVAVLIDGISGRPVTLVVDDLDLLPSSVAAPLVEALRVSDTVFIATSAPRQEVAVRDPERWSLLRPLFDDVDTLAVAIAPLTLPETAALGKSLRASRHGTEPADEAWLMALHHLSGGSPALVHELVEAAAARGRLNALFPLDPYSGPLPGGLVASIGRMLAPLDARERRLLCVVADLGPVPTSHLGSILPSDVLARFHDGNLLSAATDPGTAAVSPLVTRVARESACVRDIAREQRAIALRLAALMRRGAVLTTAEEAFCARFLEVVDGDDPSGAAVATLLSRAALALARSRSPRDALPVVARALANGPDLRASAALVMARVALGEYDVAMRLLDDLPAPTNAAERELALGAYVRALCATCAGLDEGLTRVRGLVRWAPDDTGWRLRVEYAVASLALLGGTPTLLPSIPVDALDRMEPDAVAVVEACQAAVEASRGNAAAVRLLLARRQRTHGMDVESNFLVFRLHAYALMMLGEDLDVVQNAARRRMLSALWADRQDDVVFLALMDASIQLMRGRPGDVFVSLQIPEIVPPESVRIWYDAVGAVASVGEGDLVSAAAALERIDAASRGWARGGFGVVRETVCALFEAANHRTAAAAARAERALDEAQRSMPIIIPTLLRLVLAGGATVAEVRDRAAAIAERTDLEILHAFVAEMQASMRPTSMHPLERLTSREREVVQLSASGATNAQIAQRLRLSVRTVESHLHHARTRLGMSRHERFSPVDDAGASTPRLASGMR